jgi:DNA-binding transcriptional MerR regulator
MRFPKKYFSMLIGQLSRLSGFSRDTIRFYEKEGLIKLGRKQRTPNNYRNYSDEILQRLLIIKKLKGYGFTLNETAELIALMEENMASCHTVNEQVQAKVQAIEQKIAELKSIKNRLLEGVALCLEGNEPSNDRSCKLVTPGD